MRARPVGAPVENSTEGPQEANTGMPHDAASRRARSPGHPVTEAKGGSSVRRAGKQNGVPPYKGTFLSLLQQ